MGFVKNLFGGGKQKVESTSRVEYSPEEEARRKQIFDIGAGLYESMAPSIGTYRGPQPVGADPATTAAQGMTLMNAGGAQGLLGPAAQSSAFALNDAKYVESNPYLQQAIEAAMRPQIQTFQEKTMPALALGGVQTGTLGSSRQGIAEAGAARGLQESLASTAASMANRGYESGLEASLQAQRALPSIMESFGVPGAMVSGVGAQRENLAQEQANYEAAGRIAEVTQPWDLLNSYASLLQGMANPTTVSTSQQPRQGITLPQIIGGGLSAASLGKMFNLF